MGLASRNTAKGITAMSKKNTNVKKPATKKNVKTIAPPAASLMPTPDVLAAVPSYDKKEKRWEASICEGKLEHTVLNETFESDDAAKVAGEAWLGRYTQANEATRRKMLGWKPAKGKTIGELASAMEKKIKGDKKADATAGRQQAQGQARAKAKFRGERIDARAQRPRCRLSDAQGCRGTDEVQGDGRSDAGQRTLVHQRQDAQRDHLRCDHPRDQREGKCQPLHQSRSRLLRLQRRLG